MKWELSKPVNKGLSDDSYWLKESINGKNDEKMIVRYKNNFSNWIKGEYGSIPKLLWYHWDENTGFNDGFLFYV